MSKSSRKQSTSSKSDLRLSIRFGMSENGMIFMEYREENAKDPETEVRAQAERRLPRVLRSVSTPEVEGVNSTLCQQCGESEAERGSEYCPVCLVMFATLARP